MIEIKADIPDLKIHGDMERQLLSVLVTGVAGAAYAHFQKIAATRLRSTYQTFIRGLDLEPVNDLEHVITLEGFLPRAMEFGHSPFDMKPWLLHGPKARKGRRKVQRRGGAAGSRQLVTYGSVYNIVPFFFATSRTSVHFETLPPEISKMVSGKAFTREQDIVTLEGFGDRYRGANRVTGYQHKVSKYERLTRTRHPETRAAGRPHTFRTVSTRSDPGAWWHPGFTPKNMRNDVMQYVVDNFADWARNIMATAA